MKIADTVNVPAGYREAFDAVDRAWFIPARIWVRESFSHGNDDDTDDDIAVDRDTDPELWQRAAYADIPVVTQWDDGRTIWPDIGYLPTCSASAPSVVATMVAALDPQPGDSVLEIGSGTGYNAALLSEIVGETGRVVTIEVDPALADDARTRLRRYPNVDVLTADGTGQPIAGEWDRIIATASVHVGRIPYWWVGNTRPSGVILAPMRTDLSSGPLVRFVVGNDGTATGHAQPDRVGFMSLRSHRVTGGGFSRIPWDDPNAEVTETDLEPWVPLLDQDHCWPIALALPSCRFDVWEKTDDRAGVALLADPVTRSWASVTYTDTGDRLTVRQHGSRRLWDTAQHAYQWWQHHGHPPLPAWRWTITPDQQTCTLDD